MSRNNKAEAILEGVSTLFYSTVDLLEQQKNYRHKLRRLRVKLSDKGLETDFENLKNDWQQTQGDLTAAREKLLQDGR